jgi:hypothetical protein
MPCRKRAVTISDNRNMSACECCSIRLVLEFVEGSWGLFCLGGPGRMWVRRGRCVPCGVRTELENKGAVEVVEVATDENG